MNRYSALALLFFALVSAVSGRVAADTDVATNTLPKPPVAANAEDLKDFKVRDVTSKVPAGSRPSGETFSVVDILDGAGEWATVSDAEMPPFPKPAPAELKGKLQYFTASNDAGWMLVPRGWKLWRAAMGADGNSWFTYAAPTGSKDGWMVTGEIPACVGCMLSDTDGLIPGAHQKLIDAGLADEGSKEAQVIPKPDSLTVRSHCVATFAYHMPASPPIHAVVYLGPGPGGDQIERALYVALPDSDKALVDYILMSFMASLPACE